ncbi:type 1 glutamine amidotransferase domain-containing protein [Mesorhizobium sp. INR15]|uniref:type 1 glutamine amidotransferase domain-containing protein n=1 Tax=Mesorhizobium sp. INR15 TaxID=2654248 RepID=UPI0021563233|nr:type 1 glutamine amidotransferase domain-containing protein [Mesorhizobium sp. INR15]
MYATPIRSMHASQSALRSSSPILLCRPAPDGRSASGGANSPIPGSPLPSAATRSISFGGKCEADALSDPRDASGYSETDLISLGFLSNPKLAALVENTRQAAEIDVGSFDAIVVAGGQSPMFTYERATDLQQTFVAFHEAGKVAAALCHGTAILRYARRADGSLLAAGKTVTGFANIEEDFADKATWEMGALERGKHLMPWRIEDELKAIGANYIQAGLWRGFAVRDGNLITGQQNFSGAETARLVCEALGG